MTDHTDLLAPAECQACVPFTTCSSSGFVQQAVLQRRKGKRRGERGEIAMAWAGKASWRKRLLCVDYGG